MLHPELEEKLHNAKLAIHSATTENIVELCKQYLTLLAQYRNELYKLAGTPRINLQTASSSSLGDVNSARKIVRGVIENTTQERNKIEALLRSFIAVSGYEAVETLNSSKHKNFSNWKVKAGGVRASVGTDSGRMTIQEAVDAASLLRREVYILQNADGEYKRDAEEIV